MKRLLLKLPCRAIHSNAMPLSHLPIQNRLKACLLFLIALLPVQPGFAQEQASQAAAEKPAVNFQVIKRREVNAGDHTITYQLVVPPETLLPAAQLPLPVQRDLTPDELAIQKRREAKQQSVLFFSATVFDHRVTEMSWLDDWKTYRAFSNLDFQYFSGMGEIETETAIYTLIMALDSGTAEALAERTRKFP